MNSSVEKKIKKRSRRRVGRPKTSTLKRRERVLFSHRIRRLLTEARVDNMLTITTFSEILGLTKQSLHEVESGRMKMPPKWIVPVSKHLDIPVWKILDALIEDYNEELQYEVALSLLPKSAVDNTLH